MLCGNVGRLMDVEYMVVGMYSEGGEAEHVETGPKDKMEASFESLIIEGDFPFIYFGRIIRSAKSAYEISEVEDVL